MPDERREAVKELVKEWIRHAWSDMAIARMVEVDLAARILNWGDSQIEQD